MSKANVNTNETI